MKLAVAFVALFLNSVAGATPLDSVPAERMTISVLDVDMLVGISERATNREYTGLQNGRLVNAQTAQAGDGPFCMFGTGPEGKRALANGTKLQVTKIVQQFYPDRASTALLIYTQGNYLFVCTTVSRTQHAHSIEEIRSSLQGVAQVSVQ